tara:strand:- start:84 stop:335 length:252 start_codon:yes stop_codon:yes gene_type:complete
MNKILAIILVVVLSGCANKPQLEFGPDGKMIYKLLCNEHRGDCTSAPATTCKEKGYTVFERIPLPHPVFGQQGVYRIFFRCNE